MSPNTKQNQATRLAYLRASLGLTVREVGEAVGRSSSRVTNWESDPNVKIKKDVLIKLAKIYKVTPEFILYGDAGAPTEHQELERAIATVREPRLESTVRILAPEDLAYIELPFIETAAYGTFGTNCQDFRPEEFSTYSVLKIKGVDYRNALVMEIKGNSMAPRYPERSRYVIRSVSSGNWQYAQGVHAISLRSAAFIIKRITHNKDGVLTLTSDNGGAEMSVELGEILCMWKVGEAVYMPAED